MRPSSLDDIIFSKHAADRMAEYNLTKQDVLYVMEDPDITRLGKPKGEPNFIRTLPNGHRVRVPAMVRGTRWFVFTVILES